MSGADPHIADGDLVLRPERGFAYQADLTPTIEYGARYLDPFIRCNLRIKARLMAGRLALVARHLKKDRSILDYGCGTGSFVEHALAAGYERVLGFDINPQTRAMLVASELYGELLESFDAVCAWDVVEHLPRPRDLLRRVKGLFFASLPIFADLGQIRSSKHYKPGEHLFYYTDAGFVQAVEEEGFALLERSTHEIDAGRESIGAFAFARHGASRRAR